MKSGGAALAVGATLGLSGCAGMLGESSGPGYATWLYAPGAIQSRDHYGFTYLDAAEFSDNEDELGDWYTMMKESTTASLEPASLDFGDVDGVVSASPATVYTGSFDPDGVAAALEDSGFSETTQHEGYDIYVGGGSQAYGVGDDALTVASNAEDGEGVLKTVIDADEGSEDRYVDDNEDMKALTDVLGERTYVNGRTRAQVASTDTDSGEFAGEVANGGGFDVDGDTTELTVGLVFDAADDASTDDVQEWVDSDTFEDVEDTEVSQSDRVVTVTGTAETNQFFG